MALKGNLDPTFLSGLFQIFSDEKKTGVFTAECVNMQVKLYIQNGDIVHATGDGKSPLLADILRHRSILPANQVDQIVTTAKQNDACLCRTLLTSGFLDEQRLHSLLMEITTDLLIHLFQQTQGEFEYQDMPVDEDKLVLIHLDIRRAIMDTFRLLDELAELKERLPDEKVQFTMVQQSQKDSAYPLDAVAWRMLALIHAKMPLKEILRQSSYNAHVVYTSLLGLLETGMITFSAEWEDNIHAVDAVKSKQPAPSVTEPESRPKEKGLFGFFKKK